MSDLMDHRSFTIDTQGGGFLSLSLAAPGQVVVSIGTEGSYKRVWLDLSVSKKMSDALHSIVARSEELALMQMAQEETAQRESTEENPEEDSDE